MNCTCKTHPYKGEHSFLSSLASWLLLEKVFKHTHLSLSAPVRSPSSPQAPPALKVMLGRHHLPESGPQANPRASVLLPAAGIAPVPPLTLGVQVQPLFVPSQFYLYFTFSRYLKHIDASMVRNA